MHTSLAHLRPSAQIDSTPPALFSTAAFRCMFCSTKLTMLGKSVTTKFAASPDAANARETSPVPAPSSSTVQGVGRVVVTMLSPEYMGQRPIVKVALAQCIQGI